MNAKRTPNKSRPDDDDDRLTPEEEKQLAFSEAQGSAGLTYGPFEKDGLSLQAFMKARERQRRVSIRIPAVLFDYLETEAKRFDLRPHELMATILETHQFKDQDRQLILLAIHAHIASRRSRHRRGSGPPQRNKNRGKK